MKAFCPNCGGGVEFRFGNTVQTTCGYCQSILVRKDADIRKVGQVAELPPSMSPVQIGTEGQYQGQAFWVAGRIIYDWEQGRWNEWHIVFQDGRNAWLSDAQAEYAVTRAAPFPSAGVTPDEFFAGRKVAIGGREFTVASTTRAHYRGVEGELPFEYWDKNDVTFVDLRSTGPDFATIDFSESPPLLFFGEAVDFAALKLTYLKQGGGADEPKAQASAINCPNCGAGVEIRAKGQAVTIACTNCAAVLDATTPSLRLLRAAQDAQKFGQSAIPLGAKGKFEGEWWQNIGYQVRSITLDNVNYAWREYVLFNDFRGFRYLTEYNGHWNDVKPVKHLPTETTAGGKRAMSWMGLTYKHFQTATAKTDFVLGEFPWRVQVGERVGADDFVSPPYMLSAERTLNEISWSHSEYTSAADIWQRFALKTPPPRAEGVFANQPSPHQGSARSAWTTFAALAALLFGSLMLSRMMQGNREVFAQRYTFDPNSQAEASFVTSTFELTGRAANVEARIESDVSNNWVYFNLSLINQQTGQSIDWGREVSFYEGLDSDGYWSEGGRNDTTRVGHVPAGQYYLLVEPQWEAQPGGSAVASPVHYTLTLRRDVTVSWPYFVALILLLIPAIVISVRGLAFETARWNESDYSSGGSDD
ncbi:MAG: DUF4178 domain-containing protein [Acidobacteria bacterium]|nr:DUF4178 domain-containing protein [Acidobacteriota bacterium]